MILLFLLSVSVGVLYSAIMEYIAHRWFMHLPFPTRTTVYVRHAIEHHGKGRNDLNIAMDLWAVILLGSPLFLGCFAFGWIWFGIVVAGMLLYKTTWTKLHSAHHDLCHIWVKSIPGYKYWRCHHLLHHLYPNRNYGAVFVFSDYLFGTKLRP